jgi:hypothetical protein
MPSTPQQVGRNQGSWAARTAGLIYTHTAGLSSVCPASPPLRLPHADARLPVPSAKRTCAVGATPRPPQTHLEGHLQALRHLVDHKALSARHHGDHHPGGAHAAGAARAVRVVRGAGGQLQVHHLGGGAGGGWGWGGARQSDRGQGAAREQAPRHTKAAGGQAGRVGRVKRGPMNSSTRKGAVVRAWGQAGERGGPRSHHVAVGHVQAARHHVRHHQRAQPALAEVGQHGGTSQLVHLAMQRRHLRASRGGLLLSPGWMEGGQVGAAVTGCGCGCATCRQLACARGGRGRGESRAEWAWVKRAAGGV